MQIFGGGIVPQMEALCGDTTECAYILTFKLWGWAS